MRTYYIDFYCEEAGEWINECTITRANKKQAEEHAAKTMPGKYRVRCAD